MPEIIRGWSPRLMPGFERDALLYLWSVHLGLQLQRPVAASEVHAAMLSRPSWVDPGLEPAVARWRAVPLDVRFCPPGIVAPCTEADVRMWLQTGSSLEREFIQWR